MKKILLQVSSPIFANDAIFKWDINNMNEPWRKLKSKLAELGYELVTADDRPIDDCAWILFLDSTSVDGLTPVKSGVKSLLKKLLKREAKSSWPNRPLYEEALKKNMKDKIAIFLWEGKVNNPDNYTPQIENRFKYIFTWNDELVDNKKFFKFFLPVPLRPREAKPLPFQEKKLLVNMSANRHYPRPNELYSARLKTSAYFDANYPNDFDLFGARWQIPVTRWQKYFPRLVPRFACYRGTANDKIATLSRYKFSLAYENMSGTEGYVTEKIFDILQAGSVPIYWGAPNIETYVNPNAFIDRRDFKNDAALAVYLKNMKGGEYEKMILAGQEYLKTEQFKKFLPEYFCDRIIEVLNIPKIL